MENINQTQVTEFIFTGLSEDPVTNIGYFIIFLLSYIITLLGNIIIIFLIITDHHLHSPMYYFLINLSAIDILFTSCNIPKALTIFISLRKSIYFNGCITQMYISLVLGETECILLAVMAYDRYVAICIPLRYALIMNTRFCFKVAFSSWMSGCVFATFPTLKVISLPFCGPNEINHVTCEYLALLDLACVDTTFTQLMLFPITLVVLLLPFSFIITSYIFIIRSVLNINSAEGRRKAFSTCASHLTVVCIFYGAAIVIYLGPKYNNLPDLEKYLSLFCGVLTPLLNPIIYSLRNREVKGAIIKVFINRIIFIHA
ncbi:olfactory receptor 13F1-like [Bombina bombina]|uniref:olfactory receptor 13F1-like n=1 Tax=Bombina bombina TaxID=8345 RepID=UPI00235A48B6|nr:olfactory receptor 13F1-like [Bombina bombina]